MVIIHSVTLVVQSLVVRNVYPCYLFPAGFDGGMNQTFHILVKEKGSDVVKYDNSNLDKAGGDVLKVDYFWQNISENCQVADISAKYFLGNVTI